MRKARFSEEQIINLLKGVEAGQRVADACRAHGISEQTYHRWKAKYGGLDVNEARRLKALEDENRRLKAAVADLTLDNRSAVPPLSASLSRSLKTRMAFPKEGHRCCDSHKIVAEPTRLEPATSPAFVPFSPNFLTLYCQQSRLLPICGDFVGTDFPDRFLRRCCQQDASQECSASRAG